MKYRTCKKQLANCPSMRSQYFQQTRKKAPRSPPSLTWTHLSAFNDSEDGGGKNLSFLHQVGIWPGLSQISWKSSGNCAIKAWFSENDWASTACPINLWCDTAYIKNSTISHDLTAEHAVKFTCKTRCLINVGQHLKLESIVSLVKFSLVKLEIGDFGLHISEVWGFLPLWVGDQSPS